MQTPERTWFHVTKRDKSTHDAPKTPFCKPSYALCISAHFTAINGLQIGVHEDDFEDKFSVLSTRISRIFVAYT